MAEGILNQPARVPPPGYWVFFQSDSTLVWLTAPRACAICGRSHFIFINRDGRTRCFECDDRHQESKRKGAGAAPKCPICGTTAAVIYRGPGAWRCIGCQKDFATKGDSWTDSELTRAFRNVQRVKENRCTFPLDLSESEKDDLRILAEAILDSGFVGDAYDFLRDAFARERKQARNRKGG